MDGSIAKVTLYSPNITRVYRFYKDQIYRSECQPLSASLSVLSYSEFESRIKKDWKESQQCVFKYEDGHKETFHLPLDISSKIP